MLLYTRFGVLFILFPATLGQINTDPRCSIWDNIDFFGHDLMGVNGVTSPAECNNMCRTDDVCTFWSWQKAQKKCYLKNSATGFPQTPRRNGNNISGFSQCVSECQFPQLDFRGNDYTAIDNVPSADQCQVHCNSDSVCQFWTYAVNVPNAHQRCHLKRSALGLPERIYKHTGTISGFPSCPGAFIGPRPNCKCI